MADIHQQLEDVREKIQAAETGMATALAFGAEAYTAALGHLTSLQNKENILMQQQGESEAPNSPSFPCMAILRALMNPWELLME